MAWIDCDLESVTEAGDHYIVLGRVRGLDVESIVSAAALLPGRLRALHPAVARRGGQRPDHAAARRRSRARGDGRHRGGHPGHALQRLGPGRRRDRGAGQRRRTRQRVVGHLRRRTAAVHPSARPGVRRLDGRRRGRELAQAPAVRGRARRRARVAGGRPRAVGTRRSCAPTPGRSSSRPGPCWRPTPRRWTARTCTARSASSTTSSSRSHPRSRPTSASSGSRCSVVTAAWRCS